MWFENLVMSTTSKNAQFSPQKMKLITKEFNRLKGVNEKLYERTLQYIADGSDPSVPSDLSAPANFTHVGSAQVFATRFFDAYGNLHHTLFETIESVGPEPYLRLAKVYEALARANTFLFYRRGAALPIPEWLRITVSIATAQGGMQHFSESPRRSGLTFELLEQMLEADAEKPASLVDAVVHAERQPVYCPPAFGLFAM